MSQIASREQLRGAFLRRALVAVPVVLGLGLLSGWASNSGDGNAWYALLRKPSFIPPGWAFGAAWSVLYVLQGVALALILNARGNTLRGLAIMLFIVQLALNLAWSPLFFAMHQVTAALWLIGAMFVAALATTLVFGRVRPLAAWLMVPYLAWLCFAALLNYGTHRLNPDAEQLVPSTASTQIER